MGGTTHQDLVVPERFGRSALANVVLNGASRRELLQAQAAISTCGTGLRLDHRVVLSLLVDLRDSGWRPRVQPDGTLLMRPPRIASRERQRRILARWKQKSPQEEQNWLRARAPAFVRELGTGSELQVNRITPVLNPCRNQQDHELFRFLNATWSAPQGRYLGRRLRIIVRDHGHAGHPVIGILSLGSSIVGCRERDAYIGWSPAQKRQNLVSIMDITVLGALPPYSFLLGGKLMCYVAASDQVRNYYKNRYKGRKTEQLGRCADDLALLVTSSLFGRSALYNRVRYDGEDLFEPAGSTGGFGTLHLSDTTITLMKQYLERKGALPANRFGDGPNWKMRLVRIGCEALGLGHEAVLHHGLQKTLYVVRTAHNSLEYLRGESPELKYCRRPMKQLVEYWKERWLQPRAEKEEFLEQVRAFTPSRWLERSLS